MPERDKPFDYFIQGSRILDNGRNISPEYHLSRGEVANMNVKGDAYRVVGGSGSRNRLHAPSDCNRCERLRECKRSRGRVLCEEVATLKINGMEVEW